MEQGATGMSIARDWDYAVKTMLESLEDDRLHQQRLLDGDMDSIHAALRRKHVNAALADSRIEGMPPPGVWELEILDAYIRGEIEAEDLVEVVKKAQHHSLERREPT
jgi:hypothetical protein